MSNQSNLLRINRFIAESCNLSRRKADELILQGRISKNGTIITELGVMVDPMKDSIEYDGEKLRQAKKVYFLLNKPKGFVCTTSDEKKRPIVTELVKDSHNIYPVGRLDFNTTGILLLTNDGDFSHFILHPSRKVKRVYIATLNRPLDDDHIIRLQRGIKLKDGIGKFTSVDVLDKHRTVIRVSTVEGRNHFVKNMFSTLKYMVIALHREAFGPFNVIHLHPGEYRKIQSKEIEAFYASV